MWNTWRFIIFLSKVHLRLTTDSPLVFHKSNIFKLVRGNVPTQASCLRKHLAPLQYKHTSCHWWFHIVTEQEVSLWYKFSHIHHNHNPKLEISIKGAWPNQKKYHPPLYPMKIEILISECSSIIFVSLLWWNFMPKLCFIWMLWKKRVAIYHASVLPHFHLSTVIYGTVIYTFLWIIRKQLGRFQSKIWNTTV